MMMMPSVVHILSALLVLLSDSFIHLKVNVPFVESMSSFFESHQGKKQIIEEMLIFSSVSVFF